MTRSDHSSTPRLPWLTLASAGAALAAHSCSDSPLALAYLPGAPTLAGLLGCHFAHFSTKHLLWDLLTFSVVAAYVERRLPRAQAWFMVSALLLVPPAACALTPWVQAYAGLSGLVLGQVALALSVHLRRAFEAHALQRIAALLAALALLIVKQLYECSTGNTSLVTMDYQGFATVPAAHLVSVLLGSSVGMLVPERRVATSRARLAQFGTASE